MSKVLEKLQFIFGDPTLRRRIFFALGLLAVARIFAVIPIPVIDVLRLQSLFSGSEFLSLLNIFSGGGLSNLSIVMLGVGPYITGSIIMQLMTVMSPKLKALYQEEGEAGRKRFAQYSRLLTVPLALLQGYAFIKLLQNQSVLPPLSFTQLGVDLLIIVAGSMLLVWIGELITEFGIGNGVSLIIFAGIIAGIPGGLSQLLYTATAANIPAYLGFFGANDWRARWERLPFVAILTTLALIFAQPLGLALQRDFTTSGDMRGLEIVSVQRRGRGGLVTHFVATRG